MLKKTETKVGAEKYRHLRLTAKQSFRELRVTGNLTIIVVSFTAGWTYFIGTHIYEEFNEVIGPRNMIHEFFMIVTPWLMSSLNPVLYFFLTRSIRQGLVRLFRIRKIKLQLHSSKATSSQNQTRESIDILEDSRPCQPTTPVFQKKNDVIVRTEICRQPLHVKSSSHVIQIHFLDVS